MRIGEVNIEPVEEPTRTGLYLVRRKNGSFIGVGRLAASSKSFLFSSGRAVPVEAFECYGPLMFPAQANKIHTTYQVDFVTPGENGAAGGNRTQIKSA